MSGFTPLSVRNAARLIRGRRRWRWKLWREWFALWLAPWLSGSHARHEGPGGCVAWEDHEECKRAVARVADWIERDRREPDKTLCNVASLRRIANARD